MSLPMKIMYLSCIKHLPPNRLLTNAFLRLEIIHTGSLRGLVAQEAFYNNNDYACYTSRDGCNPIIDSKRFLEFTNHLTE
jgi:hypothetical protein